MPKKKKKRGLTPGIYQRQPTKEKEARNRQKLKDALLARKKPEPVVTPLRTKVYEGPESVKRRFKRKKGKSLSMFRKKLRGSPVPSRDKARVYRLESKPKAVRAPETSGRPVMEGSTSKSMMSAALKKRKKRKRGGMTKAAVRY